MPRYLEIGAGDGGTGSPTRALDTLGWRGVLLEARPDAAAQCSDNRPQADVHAVAVVAADEARVELHRVVEAPRWSFVVPTPPILRPHQSHRGPIRSASPCGRGSWLTSLRDARAGEGALDLVVMDLAGGEGALLDAWPRGSGLARLVAVAHHPELAPPLEPPDAAAAKLRGYNLLGRTGPYVLFGPSADEALAGRVRAWLAGCVAGG